VNNLYLKEIEEKDINLLIEYNKDFKKHFPNRKLYINENTFENWLKELKLSQKDISKVHIFPYWLMNGDKAIGMPILKTNVEADKYFEKHGGHISYVIAPSYRMKGYGTKCLHLALKECKKLGLNQVLICCDDRNIGSANVIENNYGILKDTCIESEGEFTGRFHRRYLIKINESLALYEQNAPKRKSTLNQICNLDRSNLDSFLINNMQSEVGEETLKFSEMVSDVNNIEDIANLYQTFMQEFKPDSKKEVEKFKRLTEEIIKSRICSGCNDAGLVLSTILRLKGIPTVFVSSAHIDWIKELQNENKNASYVQGHIFLEIYLNNKWYLFDSMAGKIYDNYDYNNLSLPDGYYAFRKTLNNCNFGAYDLKINNEIMYETFIDFDLIKYSEPFYEGINLKKINNSISK